MSADPEGDALNPTIMDNYETVLENLSKEVQDLHLFKDMFFENHPLDKADKKGDIILQKRDELAAKFEAIDEATIPSEGRAEFLYLKGRCYNILSTYEHQALECLSKAVKLDPSLVHAWNELGECYWKNFNLKEAKACFEGALNQASPTCEDVIKTCNWPVMHAQKWQTERCCDLFQPIFTNYGLCYAFNSLPLNGMTNETLPWQKSFNEQASPAALEWGLDVGYPKTFPPNPTMTPLRVMASGETNGLGLELYLNTSDHQFECDGNSLGFTVLISSPTDHVYTSTVIRLPMNRMTTVEVYPLTYKTDSSLRSLTPAQRQCFFQNERRLEYFEFYTDSNCKHDLLVQETRNMCDCVLFNWPRKNERDPICSTATDYNCINKVKAKVEEQLIYAYYAESDEQAAKKESQSCHPSCNDVIYSSQVFYSDLTKDLDSSRHWGQPKIGEVTQINVHFYDDMFLGQHRHAQYDHYYFVGAIGGLLSLFLGFSIISVAELVYFVILRPAYVVLKETYCL